MNEYINECVDFITKFRSGKGLPERDTLIYEEDGTHTIHVALSDYIYLGQITVPEMLEICTYFMVYDSYFESKNVALEGKPFRKKYLCLPKNNNLEKIVSSIYRILKVYRNACVHNMSAITQSGNLLIIDYNFMNTNFALSISKRGLDILKEFILVFFHYYESEFSDLYLELLFNGYYSELLKEIIRFNDEDGDNLPKFSDSICRHVRIEYEALNYSECNNKIIFRIQDEHNDTLKYPIDIKFEYGGKKHILPIEVLNSTKRIDLDKIMLWEVKI